MVLRCPEMSRWAQHQLKHWHRHLRRRLRLKRRRRRRRRRALRASQLAILQRPRCSTPRQSLLRLGGGSSGIQRASPSSSSTPKSRSRSLVQCRTLQLQRRSRRRRRFPPKFSSRGMRHLFRMRLLRGDQQQQQQQLRLPRHRPDRLRRRHSRRQRARPVTRRPQKRNEDERP